MEKQYVKTLELLELNPHHPSLRLHGLSGRLEGLQSISINLNYRITMEMIITDNEIVLINIGDHDAVYWVPHRLQPKTCSSRGYIGYRAFSGSCLKLGGSRYDVLKIC